MMPFPSLRQEESGFTLVEVMVAMFVLLVGMAGSVVLIDGANSTTRTTKAREAANNLAREVVEDVRAIPYEELTPALVQARLQAVDGLGDEDSATPGWNVKRRGTTYTVTASVCSVDDGQDQLGSHASGGFCGTGAGGTADKDPEDYKRVTVTASWQRNGGTRSVRQTAVVNNPGNSAGVAITTLAPTAGATQGSGGDWTVTADSVTFGVTTSRPAQSVEWWLDGNAKPPPAGSGSSWSFAWDVTGLLDGVYTVGAQAVDAFGRSAGARYVSMVVDRSPPATPTGFKAGRNGSYVDLVWNPNAEGDVIGYTVSRQDGGQWVEVAGCLRIAVTSCRDVPPTGAGTTYRLIAYDRSRESAPAYAVVPDPVTGNRPPAPPTNLAGTPVTATSNRLSWTRSTGDPDAGDGVSFYRIYRDGQPYDTTTDASYTDAATGGVSHSYSVTAVDTRFAESSPAGPVTVSPGYTP